MLLKPKINCQVPYGAFDQKINYQYNLLRAALITFACVGAILGALLVANASTKPKGDNGSGPVMLDTIRVVIDFGPGQGGTSQPIRPEPPPPESGPRGIPVPVAIEDWPDETDGVDSSLVGEVGVGDLIYTGIGSAGGNVTQGGGGVGSRFPDASKFIPHEIAPQGLEWAIPEYPRLAKAAGLEGVVWIAAFVDERGKVQAVQIAKASGSNAGFERAAEAAAWKCTFSPAVQNGNPVAIWVTFSFRFRLSHD